MSELMRCLYCGLLQDEPAGVKVCARCGGELVFERSPAVPSYVRAYMELDQIQAPAGQIVERHIVVTIQTPPEVPEAEKLPVEAGRAPLTFVAVLDVSGSMYGQKLQSAKDAVQEAVRRLQDGDIFALVTFATTVQTVLSPAAVDRSLRKAVAGKLAGIAAGGNTALCAGLEAGIALASDWRRETNLVLLLSDGQANVGETDLEKIGSRALAARQQGITTSTLGVGTDYNEALMVEIANQGGGRFYHVLEPRQIPLYMAGELGEVSALAARNAVLTLELPAGSGIQSFSPSYTINAQSQVLLGDIPVDTSLEVVLRILLPPQPIGARLPIKALLSFTSPAGRLSELPLNPVTVRFVAATEFGRRDGIVRPVIERVLEQMQARATLSSRRVAALQGRASAAQFGRLSLAELRDYASLLGDERAEEVVASQEHVFAQVMMSPPAAKAAVYEAFRRQRGAKDFGK